jgi:hypothetical protein
MSEISDEKSIRIATEDTRSCGRSSTGHRRNGARLERFEYRQTARAVE